jgi:hypothetical protein
MTRFYTTPSFLAFFLMLACSASFAQVTMDFNNFPRTAVLADSFIEVPSGAAPLVVPQEGPDQVWDYADLPRTLNWIARYFDAAGDPDFPTALNYSNGNVVFQSFRVPAQFFEAVDANGWYEMGSRKEKADFSLSQVTGMASDSLHFPAEASPYGGRLDYLKFPLSYGDQWSGTRIEQNSFALSVAAFSLNRTPGYQKRYRTEDNEVVGYGKLIIPRSDRSPSDSMDVLLVRRVITAVDSFYLGGMPAPSALLAAFNTQQGATSSESAYLFFHPGFGAPVAEVLLADSNIASSISYRAQAAEMPTAIERLETNFLTVSPNPVSRAGVLAIEWAGQSPLKHAQLLDLSGQSLYSFDLAPGQQQLRLPAELATGVYLLRLSDAKGSSLTQKLLLR